MRSRIRLCVQRYDGNRRVHSFSCWDQFLAMAFAQLTFRESRRDVEVCLTAHRSKLYHSGFSCSAKRSTLAEANERREWRIYADFAQSLIAIARPLYTDTDLGTLRSMHWTRPRSTCVSRSFPGRGFDGPKGRSNSTP